MSDKKLTKKEQFLLDAKSDPDYKHLPVKQRIQLYTLKITYGNVTKSANILGLSRSAFYYNIRNYPEYKEAYELITEIAQDFVDDVLFDVLKSEDDNARMKAVDHYNRLYSKKYANVVTSLKIDHTSAGEKIEQPQQLIFLSADKMTEEEIEKYKSKYLHQDNADSND